MVGDLKVAKKPYSTPSFEIVDPATAKAGLEAAGTSTDADTRQMLSVIDQQLNGKKSAPHSASPRSLP